jgi:glycerophosphoryl diester phosphodiesterase
LQSTALLGRSLLAFAFCWTYSAGYAFDLQGHRGARGLAPENTLAGFGKALAIGVTTLEADLAVTKDQVLVLSHTPRLNPDITRGADGRWLASPGPRIWDLTLTELRRFDVGRIKPWTRYHVQLYQQTPVDGLHIPTLDELFKLAQDLGKAPRFNIEAKTSPDQPDDTPDPETFARLIVDAVRRAGVADRTTIESFDWRTLLAVRKLAPEIERACITSESIAPVNVSRALRSPSAWLGGLELSRHGGSIPRLVKAAGCGTWLPYHGDADAASVKEARALGLKVVPWTVNSQRDMARVIDMNVDGLITDYPDMAREVLAARGIRLP